MTAFYNSATAFGFMEVNVAGVGITLRTIRCKATIPVYQGDEVVAQLVRFEPDLRPDEEALWSIDSSIPTILQGVR